MLHSSDETTKGCFKHMLDYRSFSQLSLTFGSFTQHTRLCLIPVICVCAQSCPALWDPMDCSLPVSLVHGISQASLLEQDATSFSRGSSWPREWMCISCICCTGRWIFYHSTTWEVPICYLLERNGLAPWTAPGLFFFFFKDGFLTGLEWDSNSFPLTLPYDSSLSQETLFFSQKSLWFNVLC